MSPIVVVHGMGKQLEGELTLHHQHLPALQQGLARAGRRVSPDDVEFASYGELFRPTAETLAPTPFYDVSDLDEFDLNLLLLLWERAAAVDAAVVSPDEETLSRSLAVAKRALAALSRSRFFAGIADRLVIGDLKQVKAYLTDANVRGAVQERIASCVTAATRVVVAHSLGSVVAYEALCAHPEWNVRALITLGSPLGIPNLVFDRLQPSPKPGPASPRGAWPGSVVNWTNLAAADDVVAAVEDLRPLFGRDIVQLRPDNRPRAHDMNSYLTEQLTGKAITEGLDP